MRVSKKCQYALRAVFELSWRNSNQPVKIHVIASAQNIPPRFLEMILNELRHGGFVESRRGNEGGYMLGRDPEDLSVAEIVEFVEGPIALTTGNDKKGRDGESFFGDFAFEQMWSNVSDAISQVCRETTFAQLVEYEKSQGSSFVPNYTI